MCTRFWQQVATVGMLVRNMALASLFQVESDCCVFRTWCHTEVPGHLIHPLGGTVTYVFHKTQEWLCKSQNVDRACIHKDVTSKWVKYCFGVDYPFEGLSPGPCWQLVLLVPLERSYRQRSYQETDCWNIPDINVERWITFRSNFCFYLSRVPLLFSFQICLFVVSVLIQSLGWSVLRVKTSQLAAGRFPVMPFSTRITPLLKSASLTLMRHLNTN